MMKYFALILVPILANAQTVVSRTSLELAKPDSRREVFAFSKKEDGTFYVVAADKKRETLLCYNRALFFRDSLSDGQISNEGLDLCGSGFDAAGNPVVFRESADHIVLTATTFDLRARQVRSRKFQFQDDKERVAWTFSANDDFYRVSLSEKDLLVINIFRSGDFVRKEVDLSRFPITSADGKPTTVAALLDDFPLQKVEPGLLNSLGIAAMKSKCYSSPDALIISLDHSPSQTLLFRISLADSSVELFRVPQPPISELARSDSNSFFLDGRLYQVRSSEKEMALSMTIIGKAEPEKIYRAQQNSDISFKNSPLLLQNPERAPYEVSTTKKFLRKLAGADLAVSVYQNTNGVYLSCGGIREATDTGAIVLGATVGIVAIAGGGYTDPELFGGATKIQTLFFDALFNSGFAHIPGTQKLLASDAFDRFLYENQAIQNFNLHEYDQSLLLSYYDARNKQIVIRRFADVLE